MADALALLMAYTIGDGASVVAIRDDAGPDLIASLAALATALAFAPAAANRDELHSHLQAMALAMAQRT